MKKRWLRRTLRLLLGSMAVVAGLLLWNIRPPGVGEPVIQAGAVPYGEVPPLRLRIVTWNVWGLRWITPRREERLQAIAQEVATLRPDVVGFQEAFVAADREVLMQSLKEVGLSHFQYFPSGLVGSGLLLVSRYPFASEGFIRFQENGRPEAVHHGDWWAGKGLSLSVLMLPAEVPLYVANTHLHAGYREHPYHGTRLAQARQLVPWAEKVYATGAPALWMGDWNNRPDNDVMTPLVQAGDWRLLSKTDDGIDHIFGSGEAWEWRVMQQGRKNGRLPGDPGQRWSDHAARWVDVELRRMPNK